MFKGWTAWDQQSVDEVACTILYPKCVCVWRGGERGTGMSE